MIENNDGKTLVRYDTSANWSSANPVLAKGEIGVESDTNSIKVGNGEKTWEELSEISGKTINEILDRPHIRVWGRITINQSTHAITKVCGSFNSVVWNNANYTTLKINFNDFGHSNYIALASAEGAGVGQEIIGIYAYNNNSICLDTTDYNGNTTLNSTISHVSFCIIF